MASCYRIALGALLMALPAGCGKAAPTIVPVEGVIRLGGQPLPKARVVFIPQSDAGPDFVATGLTDETGRYHLTCNGQPGACAGANRVLVLESDAPRELMGESRETQLKLAQYYRSLGNRPIPGKYGSVVQSPLRETVTPEKVQYDFELER